jgi:hypothetical protein
MTRREECEMRALKVVLNWAWDFLEKWEPLVGLAMNESELQDLQAEMIDLQDELDYIVGFARKEVSVETD